MSYNLINLIIYKAELYCDVTSERNYSVKKKNNLTIIAIIAMVIIVAAVIGSWFMKIIDIMTAGIILVAVGVIFYFIFVGINYKHSIMGGRFNEHFKNIHSED